MKKNIDALEKVFNKLGMKDYDLFIENKMLEHEAEFKDINNELYQKACKDYDDALKKDVKKGLEIESRTNWKEWFEYQHMYESGFEDGMKFAKSIIELLKTIDN